MTSLDDTVVLIQDDDLDVTDSTEDHEDGTDHEDFNEISVPLTVVLSVIGGYIIFGTVLFGLWEGWGMDVAAYYCFITISTIGFGDVVPSLTKPEDEAKLIAVCTYMLFGMATLSMCFTLVQDQMAAKFRMLGQKCGLLSRFKHSSNDDEADDDADVGDVFVAPARPLPVQPVTTTNCYNLLDPVQPVTTTPAAGTEVFEMRRRKRVERLKFRIRQQLSGKVERGVEHAARLRRQRLATTTDFVEIASSTTTTT